jgi:uncharacterized protein DUF4136
VSYKQGTLAIDLIDANRNTLVWQGIAQGRLDAKRMQNATSTIDKVVGEIFTKFPSETETTACAGSLPPSHRIGAESPLKGRAARPPQACLAPWCHPLVETDNPLPRGSGLSTLTTP